MPQMLSPIPVAGPLPLGLTGSLQILGPHPRLCKHHSESEQTKEPLTILVWDYTR